MIYFIKAESGHVKIGYTENDVEQRLSALQCGNPYNLSILAMIEGDRKQELLIHRKFKSKRCQGEWFIFDFEIEEFVENPFTLEEQKKRKVQKNKGNKVIGDRSNLPRIGLTVRRSFCGDYSLGTFLKKKEIRQSEAARDLKCSRQFIHQLLAGQTFAGKRLALRIEDWSNGYVSALHATGIDELRRSQ